LSETGRLAGTAIIAWLAWTNAPAQTPNNIPQAPEEQPARKGLLADIEAYYTAPLRWDATDWTFFAGVLAAVAVAHHFDSDVRTHFTAGSSNALASGDPNDLKDAVPAIAALVGTWLYATVSEDRDARTVAWAMTEAAGLSLTSGVVLRYATGRERPKRDHRSESVVAWRIVISLLACHRSLCSRNGIRRVRRGWLPLADASAWLWPCRLYRL